MPAFLLLLPLTLSQKFAHLGFSFPYNLRPVPSNLIIPTQPKVFGVQNRVAFSFSAFSLSDCLLSLLLSLRLLQDSLWNAQVVQVPLAVPSPSENLIGPNLDTPRSRRFRVFGSVRGGRQPPRPPPFEAHLRKVFVDHVADPFLFFLGLEVHAVTYLVSPVIGLPRSRHFLLSPMGLS